LASALAIGEDTTFDVGDEIDSALSIGKHNSERDENMATRCDGILFSDVPDIVFPPSYDFLQCYPIGIHSPAVQEQFKNYKGFVVPKWTFMPDGNIFHIHCTKQMHCELSQVQMANSGRLACDVCYSLLHSPPLIKELKMSASGDYPNKLPDPLCPLLVMHMRRANYRNECDNLRLELLNHEKTFARNRSKISDQERLIFAIHNHDVPQLKRLLGVHLTNHRSISSFMEKLTRASDQMRVGHSSHRRKLVSKASRGKRRKHRHEEFGNFDDEYIEKLDLSYLMCKLGGSHLAKAANFGVGLLSKRTVQRRVHDNTLPNFRIRVTHSINGQGRKAIEMNVQDTFASEEFKSFLPSERCIAVLMVDGVAVEERLDVDMSQIPHQWTGLCRHCRNCDFNTYDDAIHLLEKLNSSNVDDQVHLAVEAEVFCIGLVHKTCTTIIPVAVSPTCKKDDHVQESTDTVHFLLDSIEKAWRDCNLHESVGPLATIVSDGAAHFRKAAGKLLNDDLPKYIWIVYENSCDLFNLTGSCFGTTMAVDLDHLGKRFRERVKSNKGIAIGNFVFTKDLLQSYLCMAGVVNSNVAMQLLNPEDSMDVDEMVRCLQALGALRNMEYAMMPQGFRNTFGSESEFKAMKLFGNLSRTMCNLIIGHEGGIEEEKDHMSIEMLLCEASKLSHMLFFMYRMHRTNFIPNQNYRNWQDTIKNLFVVVTIAKHEGMDDIWWFLNTSKRLEQLFGILRSQRNGNLNFDCLDLRDRIGTSVGISQVFARHPEWRSPARRLTTFNDRKNTRSWKGITQVAAIDEAACWQKGKDDAIRLLRDAEVFTYDELNIAHIKNMEPSVDMQRPCSEQIGVLAGD
jgi:hypothetical protein